MGYIRIFGVNRLVSNCAIRKYLFSQVKFAFLIDKLTVAANFKCKHFLRFVLLAEACYKILVKHTESVLTWPQQENVSVNILDPHKIDWNW